MSWASIGKGEEVLDCGYVESNLLDLGGGGGGVSFEPCISSASFRNQAIVIGLESCVLKRGDRSWT